MVTHNSAALRRIDDAFNRMCDKFNETISGRPPKRRRLEPRENQGGFVLGDSGGGFLLDELGQPDSEESDLMPLSCVPDALQWLDLRPDDDEVLQIFQNAAQGWTGHSEGHDPGGRVTRKDFRAVCLILLGEEDEDETDQGNHISPTSEDVTPMVEEDGSSSHRNTPNGSGTSEFSEEEEDDTEDDEFTLTPSPSHRRLNRPKATKSKRSNIEHSTSDHDSNTHSRPITARQKQICLQTFQLFFPSVPTPLLANQKLMLKDLIRVADSLKEKMKVEEMLDMLDEFSTDKDKSMNLADFERMMMAAKLA